jgi:hypothetical protein
MGTLVHYTMQALQNHAPYSKEQVELEKFRHGAGVVTKIGGSFKVFNPDKNKGEEEPVFVEVYWTKLAGKQWVHIKDLTPLL